MTVLQFENVQMTVAVEKLATTPGGYILKGSRVTIDAPHQPEKFYEHGWQSWSLAAWTDFSMRPAPKPTAFLPRMVDPIYARHPSPHGSWVSALSYPEGQILLLGSLGLGSHVQYRQGRLEGWYEDINVQNPRWFVGYGPENQVFDTYANLLKEELGSGSWHKPFRVWCSWYGLYTSISELSLLRTLQRLQDLPFDVFQVDDGWQKAIGDWQPNDKFPGGMDGLAGKIRAAGKKAGLWLAPLLVVPSSRLYQEHSDWLLRDENGKLASATFNWREQLYALDTTHPQALEWLAGLMSQVREWGYEYVKLDFLYAGALPGKRHVDMPREKAYRLGLEVMRKALGEKVYLLTCGAPILPSIGLCDGMRIGPDVAAMWESYRDSILLCNPTTPSAKNAIRTTINRLWLAPLVHTDPDVVFFREKENQLTSEQKTLLQDLALVCKFKACSDLPDWLTADERKKLEEFYKYEPSITRTGRYTFRIDEREVDFDPAITIPDAPRGLDGLLSAGADWLASHPWILSSLETLDKKRTDKLLKELENKTLL